MPKLSVRMGRSYRWNQALALQWDRLVVAGLAPDKLPTLMLHLAVVLLLGALHGHQIHTQQRDERRHGTRHLVHLIPTPQMEAKRQPGTHPHGHPILTRKMVGGPLRGMPPLVRRIHTVAVALVVQPLRVDGAGPPRKQEVHGEIVVAAEVLGEEAAAHHQDGVVSRTGPT